MLVYSLCIVIWVQCEVVFELDVMLLEEEFLVVLDAARSKCLAGV